MNYLTWELENLVNWVKGNRMFQIYVLLYILLTILLQPTVAMEYLSVAILSVGFVALIDLLFSRYKRYKEQKPLTKEDKDKIINQLKINKK